MSGLRRVPNSSLIDGAKLDNLPADTNAALSGKLNSTFTAAQLNTAITDNDVALINGGNTFSSEQVVQYGLYSSDVKTGAKVKIKNTTDGGDAILQLSSDDSDWGISARNGYAGNNLSIFSNFGGTPSEVMTIGADGSLTVNGQNWTSGWTSWTPTIYGNSGSGATLGTVTARYKVIGKSCFVEFRGIITSKGTVGGDVYISKPLAGVAIGTGFGGGIFPIGSSLSRGFPTNFPGYFTFTSSSQSALLQWTTVAVNDEIVLNGVYELA